MNMAQICIICSKEAQGIPVEDTQVIKAIRALKQKFGIASNNKLVVCAESMEEYKKRRKSFEGKLLFHSVAALFLVAVSVLLPLFGGRFEIAGFFMVLLLAIFLVGLALLSYVPPLERGAVAEEQTSQAKMQGKGGLLGMFSNLKSKSQPSVQSPAQQGNSSPPQNGQAAGLHGSSSSFASKPSGYSAKIESRPAKGKPSHGGKKVK